MREYSVVIAKAVWITVFVVKILEKWFIKLPQHCKTILWWIEIPTKFSFLPIAEVTIVGFIDFNLRSSSKMTTFAVNVTGITYEIEYYKVSV